MKNACNKAKDKTGYLIPECIQRDWRTAEQTSGYVNKLLVTRQHLEKQRCNKAYSEVSLESLVDLLKAAQEALERAIPYAVCPTCKGKAAKDTCLMCSTRGFVSEFYWKKIVPSELRELREKIQNETTTNDA